MGLVIKGQDSIMINVEEHLTKLTKGGKAAGWELGTHFLWLWEEKNNPIFILDLRI